MKYTRYDLKKKNNNVIFFVLVIAGILALAVISGTIISNMFIKGGNDQGAKNKGNDSVQVVKKEQEKSNKDNTENKKENMQENTNKNVKSKTSDNENSADITDYVIIQCGVFSNDENAKKIKEELKGLGNSFLVKEDGKVKVVLGVYSEKDGKKISNILDGKNKEYSQKKFNLKCDNECDVQICKLLDANLQILHKLSDNKVKKVQTKQIKEWLEGLKDVSDNSQNYKVLMELKKNTKSLPAEITRENIDKQYQFLYNVFKNFE